MLSQSIKNRAIRLRKEKPAQLDPLNFTVWIQTCCNQEITVREAIKLHQRHIEACSTSEEQLRGWEKSVIDLAIEAIKEDPHIARDLWKSTYDYKLTLLSN